MHKVIYYVLVIKNTLNMLAMGLSSYMLSMADKPHCGKCVKISISKEIKV